MLENIRQAYIEETTELLSELEFSLLELENNAGDQEIIARVFRALHTIKGSSGMFGYDGVSKFVHDIETVFDLIRKGELNITKEIIDLTLTARDHIIRLIAAADGSEIPDIDNTKTILDSFKNILTLYYNKNEVKLPAPVIRVSEANENPVEKAFHIYFKPAKEIFLSGANPLLLIDELKSLGESIVLAGTDFIPNLSDISTDFCYLYWNIVLLTGKGIDAIKDVFIFIDDSSELKIKEISCAGELLNKDVFKSFEMYLSEKVLLKSISIEPELIKFKEKYSCAKNKSVQDEKKEKAKNKHNSESDTATSIRVKADKLDELVNLVGELVTVQARLFQVSSISDDNNLLSISEEVERITWSLRDSIFDMRMLPIGTTFSKFKRLVRDLSLELGKKVELITEGAETELDKTVIEKLTDPLIHIIRNSIDHGIETPLVREKRDKPSCGRICLAASQSGGSVIIKISDDGAGMDKDAIRQKALASGLIAENIELSDNEIYSLVFAPGFSTASNVTNVSGRGVGMDVVKRAIVDLKGTIEIQSAKGFGTDILLKLPLTLAIIDGLLVKIAEDFFIIPLSIVEECIEFTKKNSETTRQCVNIRGNLISYINLRKKFNIKDNCPSIQQIVVVNSNGTRIGFVVDSVLGQHQTVLKSLGKYYKYVNGISGATILGDGTVALILDIGKILESMEMEEKLLS